MNWIALGVIGGVIGASLLLLYALARASASAEAKAELRRWR